MNKMTINIQQKRKVTEKEKSGLLSEIVEADEIITNLTIELKEYTADKKEAIEELRLIIGRCCRLARDGFEEETHECEASYVDGVAKFTDIHSGEVVEERPMTEKEQLALSEHIIDAEQIIRGDRE